jgi:hypothetical protein
VGTLDSWREEGRCMRHKQDGRRMKVVAAATWMPLALIRNLDEP